MITQNYSTMQLDAVVDRTAPDLVPAASEEVVASESVSDVRTGTNVAVFGSVIIPALLASGCTASEVASFMDDTSVAASIILAMTIASGAASGLRGSTALNTSLKPIMAAVDYLGGLPAGAVKKAAEFAVPASKEDKAAIMTEIKKVKNTFALNTKIDTNGSTLQNVFDEMYKHADLKRHYNANGRLDLLRPATLIADFNASCDSLIAAISGSSVDPLGKCLIAVSEWNDKAYVCYENLVRFSDAYNNAVSSNASATAKNHALQRLIRTIDDFYASLNANDLIQKIEQNSGSLPSVPDTTGPLTKIANYISANPKKITVAIAAAIIAASSFASGKAEEAAIENYENYGTSGAGYDVPRPGYDYRRDPGLTDEERRELHGD